MYICVYVYVVGKGGRQRGREGEEEEGREEGSKGARQREGELFSFFFRAYAKGLSLEMIRRI